MNGLEVGGLDKAAINSVKVILNKIEAAEIQLNEAIFLFFDNAHPIVIETLIGAVVGVLRPLGKEYGIKAPLHDSDLIKPEFKREWIWKYLHKVQNFCKHSDRDYEAILSYEADVLPIYIYEACHLYGHLSSEKCINCRQSKAVTLYQIWFWLKYPQLLKDPMETKESLRIAGLPKSFRVDDFELLGLTANKCRIKRVNR